MAASLSAIGDCKHVSMNPWRGVGQELAQEERRRQGPAQPAARWEENPVEEQVTVRRRAT